MIPAWLAFIFGLGIGALVMYLCYGVALRVALAVAMLAAWVVVLAAIFVGLYVAGCLP